MSWPIPPIMIMTVDSAGTQTDNETFLCVLFVAFFCIYSACMKTQTSCFCYNNHNNFSLVSLHVFFPNVLFSAKFTEKPCLKQAQHAFT